MSLVIIYDETKILLAMKKRGFAAGRWNGYGGKVRSGEGIEQAAIRELEEESSIKANGLIQRGKLTFTFEDGSDELEVHLFRAEDYVGEPQETEEMKPKWFLYSDIPYTEMWADDVYWMPQFLQDKNIRGTVHFNNPKDQQILTNTIESYE